MFIGSENVFQVGSRVEAASVGSRNTFCVKSRVVSTIEIPDDCYIGPACILTPTYSHPQREDLKERLQDLTVVYGQNPDRRIGDGVGKVHQRALLAKHLDYLRNVGKFVCRENITLTRHKNAGASKVCQNEACIVVNLLVKSNALLCYCLVLLCAIRCQ